MNKQELEIVKKALNFALDDPAGTSIDEFLTAIAEYLNDELPVANQYEILQDLMDDIYPPEKSSPMFNVIFIAPAFQGRTGYGNCTACAVSHEKSQVSIIYKNAGKTLSVLIRVNSLKYVKNHVLDTIRTDIVCKSWEIIKEVEL